MPDRYPRVLISGAGICGPVLAYWLGRAGLSVTVVERADKLRKEGQTVDIRNEGIQVIKWMGVEEEVRSRTTKEAGLKFVDSENKTKAAFPQRDDGMSFTSDVEIVRGELATVLFEASKKWSEYIFGDSIEAVEDTDSGIRVTLAKNQSRVREYDMLIVGEGLSSRTRAKVFEEDVRAPIRCLNQWVANFSYEKGETDDDWARILHSPGRRALLVRPDGFGRVRCGAICMDFGEETKLIASSQTSREKQKEFFDNLFKDVGWESEKIRKGLVGCDDLYVQEVAQARCKTWSKGRTVLVGDTAYCPSPITGMGTTAAIVGAYILAAEIVKHQDDHRAAFSAYEFYFRPWIEGIQKLPPGLPALASPETWWGIRILHSIAYIISVLVNSGLLSIVSRLSPLFGSKKLPLPDPSIFQPKQASRHCTHF